MCVLACRDRCIASLLAFDSQVGRDKLISTVAESSLPQEDVVVQRWWSLAPGTRLPLMDGRACQLIFAGRSGGSAGPDVRDAVLLFPDGEQCTGDIEFHVRTSDWIAHKHATDSRYNNVMLHVVLLCDDPLPTKRQDGHSIPICSLYDLPIVFVPKGDADSGVWPCHTVMRNLSVVEQEKLLYHAGLLRFEQKTHTFVEALHKMETNGQLQGNKHDRCRAICHSYTDRHCVACHVGSCIGVTDGSAPVMPLTTHSDESIEPNIPCVCRSSMLSNVYNSCLIPALAEALAYGRDRAFFRAVGQRLLGQDAHIPEPLGRAPAPSPLDAKRLKVLHTLLDRETDMWDSLQRILVQAQNSENTTLEALRKYFGTLGLSLARADILLCNVVLPFAAAIALFEHNTMLGERAQKLYETHPGLPSNTITRMMCTQLLLAHEPRGSCRQQGLHYIYQQTCQAKHCAECMMGRNIL